jgi:MFS family permease
MVDTPHTTPVALARPLSRDARVIATISAAHFVSHYYILLLAPLFAFVRADYGVSYTELGIALTAFNLVSGVLQTPVGFLVDRIGARSMLVAGMMIGAAAFAVAGLVHSFWVMVAMFAVAGLGNTVYHPADYAILSQQVSSERTARAFSIHSFAGMAGSAFAPASLLFLQGVLGWRGAFILAAAVGVAVAGVVATQRDEQVTTRVPAKTEEMTRWQLLMSPVILLNFAYFTLLSFVSAGIQNYTVIGLEALFGTPFAVGSSALSAYLTLLAVGVLAGGFFVGRRGAVDGRSRRCRSLPDRNQPSRTRRRRIDRVARLRRLHAGSRLASARHDGTRGYAGRRLRDGVRIPVDRHELGLGGGAHRVRTALGSRPPAHRLSHRGGKLPRRNSDRPYWQPEATVTKAARPDDIP